MALSVMRVNLHVWPIWPWLAIIILATLAVGDDILETALQTTPDSLSAGATSSLPLPNNVTCVNVCRVSGIGGRSPVRASCHSKQALRTIEDACLHLLPTDVEFLDLSNNSIATLPSSAFRSLKKLQRLDLKQNKIALIAERAFDGLDELIRLDLSLNRIVSLNASQLLGLQSLERLKVAGNPLSRLHSDLPRSLPSLKIIDASNTRLVCDCQFQWLVEAVNRNDRKKLRVSRNTYCSWPKSLQNIPLKRIEPHLLTCGGNSGIKVLELEPGIDQVVFAGDSLLLRCRVASSVSSSGHIWWVREDDYLLNPVPLQIDFHGMDSSNHHMEHDNFSLTTKYESETVESQLHIEPLSQHHSGEWSCRVENEEGNNTQSISIYVIHHKTKYCLLNITRNNKGTYYWPRTVAGVTVKLKCESLIVQSQSFSSGGTYIQEQVAQHHCNASGHWEALNASMCPFVSETTKILEQFALMNMSKVSGNAHESAEKLLEFLKDGSILKDPIDIVFLSHTIANYNHLLPSLSLPNVLDVLLFKILGTSLSAHKEILVAAEFADGACSRLLENLWNITGSSTNLEYASSLHIEIEQIYLKPDTFSGITCSWSRQSLQSSERFFQCNSYNYSLLYENEETYDAQIQVPSDVIDYLTLNSTVLKDDLRIQFYVFDHSYLFVPPKESQNNSWEVTSPLLAVRIVDKFGTKLQVNSSVYITLHTGIYSNDVLPVWWEETDKGNGNWSSSRCKILKIHNYKTTFRCSSFGVFGLMQDTFYRIPHSQGAKFRLCPPAVYVGSLLCNFFLMASIITWAAHHRSINTMTKNKHSFVNTWVSLLLLVSIFTVGIYQTEDPRLCQIIGIILHYLSACVLLWIIVSVTNLYKKITKVLHPPEEPLTEPLPQKPIFRFYLVGWGIGIILCGISTAVNLQNYAGYSYCFLSWDASILSFYAPSAFLVVILSLFCMLTHCFLWSKPVGYSEANGGAENTELEMLDAASPDGESRHEQACEVTSMPSSPNSENMPDSAHSPITQLRAHVVTLLLFLLTWASAAITAAQPFEDTIPYNTTIFSVIYALCSSGLGLFIFIFFCTCRTDVCQVWQEKWIGKLNKDEDGNLGSMIANNVPVGSLNHGQSALSMSNIVFDNAHSNAHIDSSPTIRTKSSSASHSMPPSLKAESVKACNNLQLLTLETITDNLHCGPEVFYNPKQAGVARRFFQKQRLKQMMKQNNLDAIHRADSDCASSFYGAKSKSNHSSSGRSTFDTKYLEASIKVNNTNIHVDPSYSYSNCKQTTKAPTPEVLCVLGPSSDIFANKQRQSANNSSQKTLQIINDERAVNVACKLQNSKSNEESLCVNKPSPCVINDKQMSYTDDSVRCIINENSQSCVSAEPNWECLWNKKAAVGTGEITNICDPSEPTFHWPHVIDKNVTQKVAQSCGIDYCSECENEDNWLSEGDDDQASIENSSFSSRPCSISTSLFPAVDTSPPESLAVSYSPFESPVRKVHQNTPDSSSVASGSTSSPMQLPKFEKNVEKVASRANSSGSCSCAGNSSMDTVVSKDSIEKSSVKPILFKEDSESLSSQESWSQSGKSSSNARESPSLSDYSTSSKETCV